MIRGYWVGSRRLHWSIVNCVVLIRSFVVQEGRRKGSRHGEKLLVNLLESVDPLLELDVVCWQLCLQHSISLRLDPWQGEKTNLLIRLT